MAQKNALVLVSDSFYLEYTKQVFYSARKYGNWTGDLVLMVCDVKEEELKWFRERGIIILNPEPVIQYQVNGWPRVVFHKLYLVHPMMKKWDKLVYMDSDIMILRDINRLTRYKTFAAGVENGKLDIRGQLLHEEDLTEKGKQLISELKTNYNLKRVALNVGVMVFDTRHNSRELFEKGKNLLFKYEPVLRFPEQALFNLLFYRNWKRLPHVYNDYTFYFFKEDIEKSPHLQLMKRHSKVLHFIGLNKPWHQDCYFHEDWKSNMERVDELNRVEPEGENPSKLTDIRRAIYRFFRKLPMLIAHSTWLAGQQLQRISPKMYHLLKRFTP